MCPLPSHTIDFFPLPLFFIYVLGDGRAKGE